MIVRTRCKGASITGDRTRSRKKLARSGETVAMVRHRDSD